MSNQPKTNSIFTNKKENEIIHVELVTSALDKSVITALCIQVSFSCISIKDKSVDLVLYLSKIFLIYIYIYIYIMTDFPVDLGVRDPNRSVKNRNCWTIYTGLVSLFNHISTFVGYLMPKPSF